MPSKSKAQQRYFGMVRAVQEGKLSPSKVSPKLRDTAKNISGKDAHDFAITKHKGLPEHKKQAFVMGFLAKAAEAGLSNEETAKLAAQAGFDKEAFLGALGAALPMLGATLGGGFAAEGLGRLAASRAEQAMGRKVLQTEAARKGMQAMPQPSKMTQNIDNVATQAADWHKKYPWLFGTIGGILAPAALQPVTDSMAQKISPESFQQDQQQPFMQ